LGVGAGAGVIRQVRRIPPQRALPTVAQPEPKRVRVVVDTGLFEAAVAGATELLLPGEARFAVGDILHLVERADGRNSPRCCYRLVTRKRRHDGRQATVLPGRGQCEGRHG
jgi:hypothetical protein